MPYILLNAADTLCGSLKVTRSVQIWLPATASPFSPSFVKPALRLGPVKPVHGESRVQKRQAGRHTEIGWKPKRTPQG